MTGLVNKNCQQISHSEFQEQKNLKRRENLIQMIHSFSEDTIPDIPHPFFG